MTRLTVLTGDPADARDARLGMQGQRFSVLLDGRPNGNAAGSPLCQLGIVMELGQTSTPHVHRRVHVYVRPIQCGPQGALTLYGDELEREEWVFTNQTLWIPPGVPHVAVYPRFPDAPSLVAVETRTTADPDDDVVPLPYLWGALAHRLVELDMTSLVDVPWASTTGDR